LFFTNTKLTAEWLPFQARSQRDRSGTDHRRLPQNKRINLIEKIKGGRIKCLIATDVASRGLHITDVTHVYNFDLPDEAANYVHRVGRTARVGNKGSAYSLVCEDYGENFVGIQQLFGDTMTLRSEWYDERYHQIEDKAGNPFPEGERHSRGDSANADFRRPDRPRRFDGDRDRGRGISRGVPVLLMVNGAQAPRNVKGRRRA